MKVIVKLNDPHTSFENENGVSVSGSNEVKMELTPKVKDAIRVGLLVKVSDVADEVKTEKVEKAEAFKSEPAKEETFEKSNSSEGELKKNSGKNS